MTRGSAIALLAAVLLAPAALATPKAHPTPRPLNNQAYRDYADYYLRHYAAKSPKQSAATDPYRYFNFYGYYRSRYRQGATTPDKSDPYYYFRPYQAVRVDRYRAILQARATPRPSLLDRSLHFWQIQRPSEQASLGKPDPHGR